MSKTSCQSIPIVAENSEKVKFKSTFDRLKRNFERVYASGGDYSDALYPLARALAFSVLRKCLDPQRKTAPMRAEVSDNGQTNPLKEARISIARDSAALEQLRAAMDKAFTTSYDDKGLPVVDILDQEAADVVNALISQTLGEGLDLVHNAVVVLLEQAAEHASAGGEWLDKPYKVERVSRRVRINLDTSAAREEVETTPIQEAFRAVRRTVVESRSSRINTTGYSYVAGVDDGGAGVYQRLPKYLDIGSMDADGLYSVGIAALEEYASIIERLGLNKRQLLVLRLRMSGYGYKAIATYLGLKDESSVKRTVRQMRARAEKIGFTPDTYTAEADE